MGLVKGIVTKNDIFGHVLNLNLNKQGVTHKTFCSGSVSIIVKVSIIIYIYFRVTKLFTEGEGDDNATQDMLLGID